MNGPVGESLISLHVSDQFQGARVPEGEEMEPITKSLILVFDMIDTQIASNQCIKFSVYLADQINKFNLSREGMEKHKKRRAKRQSCNFFAKLRTGWSWSNRNLFLTNFETP